MLKLKNSKPYFSTPIKHCNLRLAPNVKLLPYVPTMYVAFYYIHSTWNKRPTNYTVSPPFKFLSKISSTFLSLTFSKSTSVLELELHGQFTTNIQVFKSVKLSAGRAYFVLRAISKNNMKIRFLKAMSDCIRDLKDWMIRDRVKLNEDIDRIRKFLSPDDTKPLVHAFITCRIDYCNSLLYGLPACQLNKMQRVLKVAEHSFRAVSSVV